MSQQLFKIQLTEQQQKMADSIKKVSDVALTSAAGDAAIKAAEDAANKMKAELDALILMAETSVQEVMINGATALYDMLGLNEPVINFVKTVVSQGLHATDIAGSAILKGMAAVNSFDVHALPMSAEGMVLGALQSITDKYIDKLMGPNRIYAEMIVEFIVDPGAAMEALLDELNTILNQIEELAISQIEKYLGLSYEEIKYYITQGKNLYKQYKAAKKAKKEKEEREKEESSKSGDNGINSSGSKTKVSVDVEVNPDLVMAQLKAWMRQTGDGIYNGFIVFQILDLVKELKEVIAQATDVSFESLAYNLETMEDVIAMLDEIGLGDDSTAIDLSMIPALNLNAIYASMNSLKEQATQGLINTAKIAATSLDVNTSVENVKTYEITTDKDSMTITVMYYTDPTKKSVSKKVYNAFSKAKDQNDVPLFSQSECKIIQDTINKLWTDYQNNSSSTTAETKANKYTIKFVLQIEPEKDKSQSEKSPNNNNIVKEVERDRQMMLEVKEETQVSEDKINEERKRNTIKLLHTLYSILKSFIGPFKLYIILMTNYKTNKAYVRSNQDENLVLLMMQALEKLGFGSSMPKKTTDPDGNPIENDMYTVRSLALYEYVTQDMHIHFDNAMSAPLDDSQKEQINEWLARNDREAREIERDKVTRLFIDWESLNQQQECLKQKYGEYYGAAPESVIKQVFAGECAKVNGTFDGMDLIEQVGNSFVYSDSKLPRLPSQIMMARSKGIEED